MSLLDLLSDMSDIRDEDAGGVGYSLEECEEAETLVHRVATMRRGLEDTRVRLQRAEQRTRELEAALRRIETLTPRDGVDTPGDYMREVKRLAKEGLEEEIPF